MKLLVAALLVEIPAMPLNASDPLAVRVARRHLAAIQNVPGARLVLDQRTSTGKKAREYQRRGDGLVPVDDEDAGQDEDVEAVVTHGQ